jgi:hypothetical protein
VGRENLSRSFESPTMSISSQKCHNVQFSIVKIFRTKDTENSAIKKQNSFELIVMNSPKESVKYSRRSKSSNGCILRHDVLNSTQIDLKFVSDISSEDDEKKFFNYNWIRESYHNGSQKLEEAFFHREREHLV